jgi:polysaccharide biosynthesis transport protein
MKDLKNCSPSDYLRILWRRKWYVLIVFATVGVGASIYAWLKPNIYRSTSRIRVESTTISQDYVRPSERSSPAEQIAAIRSSIQSRNFLGRMIQDFQLYGYGSTTNFSMEDGIKTVGSSIEITSTSKDTFNIAFTAADPQLAQSLTRRTVESLIQNGTRSRKDKAIETDQFLEEQLRKTQQNLAVSEEKIKRFKLMHLGELPEQGEANMNTLSRLDVQLAAAENSLQQLLERKKLLGSMAQDRKRMLLLTQDLALPKQTLAPAATKDAGSTPALLAKQAELAALSAKYTPQYPDVIRLSREVELLKQKVAREKEAAEKAAEVASVEEPKKQADAEPLDMGQNALPDAGNMELETINNDLKRKEKERDAILGQIKRFQARLNLAPALEQELMGLRRDNETLNQQYASLQGKKFQAQMTTNLETDKSGDAYTVVDEANLPERPLFPNRTQVILIGLGAGFVLGIGAAFGRELLDTTLGSEDEVASILKLPTLAIISEISGKEPKRLVGMSNMPKSA